MDIKQLQEAVIKARKGGLVAIVTDERGQVLSTIPWVRAAQTQALPARVEFPFIRAR